MPMDEDPRKGEQLHLPHQIWWLSSRRPPTPHCQRTPIGPPRRLPSWLIESNRCPTLVFFFSLPLEWHQTNHSCSIDAIRQLLYGRGNDEEAETRGQPSGGNGCPFRGVRTEGDELHVNPAGGTCVTGMISSVIKRLYVDDTRSMH